MSVTTITPVEEGTLQGIQWKTIASQVAFAWNGYVRLPEQHPWYGLEDWRVPVDVHGGITYGPDPDGWIGFDTLHAGDAVLMLDQVDPDADLDLLDQSTGVPHRQEGRVWTYAHVKWETLRLAQQTARAMKEVAR